MNVIHDENLQAMKKIVNISHAKNQKFLKKNIVLLFSRAQHFAYYIAFSNVLSSFSYEYLRIVRSLFVLPFEGSQ